MNISGLNNSSVMSQMVNSLMQGAQGIASGNPMQAMSAIGQMMNAFQSLAGRSAQMMPGGVPRNFAAPSMRFPQPPFGRPQLPTFGGGRGVGFNGPLVGTGGNGMSALGVGRAMDSIQNQIKGVMNSNLSPNEKQARLMDLQAKQNSLAQMMKMIQQMQNRMFQMMSEIQNAGNSTRRTISQGMSQ